MLSDVAVYSEPFMMATEMVLVPVGTKGMFRSASDFAGWRMGTIGGYVYPDGFDAAFVQGMVRREDAYTVTQNLQKLLAGRIDAMIVDDYEAAYWIHKGGWSEGDFRDAARLAARASAQGQRLAGAHALQRHAACLVRGIRAAEAGRASHPLNPYPPIARSPVRLFH